MKSQIIIINKTESLIESVLSDAFTFSVLLLCIWVSRGSTWWTFFTTLLFLFFVFGKATLFASKNNHKFKSNEEAIAFLDGQK